MSKTCFMYACFFLFFTALPFAMAIIPKPNPSEMAKSLFRSLQVTSTCKVNCSSSKVRLVCGSDGVTYDSKCEVRKAKQCDGKKIKIQKRGACDGGSKCLQEKSEALAVARKNKKDVFVPVCNSDGSFAAVQCHSQTGFCWCFTKDGEHVPGTSVHGSKPRCKGSRSGKRSKKKKGCNRENRETFNEELLKIFTNEYRRWHEGEVQEKKTIADWKFSKLDRNGDALLKFSEIRQFARMVRSFIKPKSCAKRFIKYCDSNDNKEIELKEWTACLGLVEDKKAESNSEAVHGQSDIDALRQAWKTSSSKTPPQSRESDAMIAAKGLTSILSGSLSSKSSSSLCQKERSAARANHEREPHANVYIPRCGDDGRWERIQCHEATNYCWCVDVEKGTTIPGTSAFKSQPNCDIAQQKSLPSISQRKGENPLSKYLLD